MRKINKLFSFILIFIVITLFILRADVLVSEKTDGKFAYPLKNKSYYFNISPKDNFNSLALKLITNNQPINGSVSFYLYDDIAEPKKLLAKDTVSSDVNANQFYKFSFKELKGNTRYRLVVEGSKNTPYMLSAQTDINNLKKLEPDYLIYKSRSIGYVAWVACRRASLNWFRIGWLYIISIFAYIIIMAVVLSKIVVEKK